MFWQKVNWQYHYCGASRTIGALEDHLDIASILMRQRTRLHILVGILGFQPGAGEVFPIHLANEFRAQGRCVSMIVFDMAETNHEMVNDLDSGIPVYDSAWVEEYGADRFLIEAGISVVHSHVILIDWFFFEYCQTQAKIPYVVSLHGSYESTVIPKARLDRFVDGVTHFVYTADKNLLPFEAVPEKAVKFTKLRNAMPLDQRPFPQTRAELRIGEDAIVFTLVARGIKRKGWRAAIAAFGDLRRSYPTRQMHLLLCGSGEETDRHQADHGADPGITFLGFQSRIQGLYRLSDVAIVPTRFQGESFPLCIIQALQTGTPVISTRLGEIEAMVTPVGRDPGGILIDPCRDTALFTQKLEAAMATMLSDQRRNDFARSAKTLGETYDMKEVARSYLSLFEGICKLSGTPPDD
jgi:glycosyltransferase involved in cell wall biosynthesis